MKPNIYVKICQSLVTTKGIVGAVTMLSINPYPANVEYRVSS